MTSMEHETIKPPGPSLQDLELEEGEVTDDSEEGYTPLARPEVTKPTPVMTDFPGGINVNQPRTAMDILSDQDDLNDDTSEASSDSDIDSGDSLPFGGGGVGAGGGVSKRLRKGNRDSKKLRIKPPPLLEKISQQPQGSQEGSVNATGFGSLPKKYDIWTESIQEDTLMENMRGCDVTLNGMRNRDVESYDYSLKYRLNNGSGGGGGGGTINAFHRALKRRQSNSDDSDGYGGSGYAGKRFRSMSFGGTASRSIRSGSNSHCGGGGSSGDRKHVKLRLGKRNSSDSNSNDSFQNAPRHILDLNLAVTQESNEAFAAELANKLCEEKDDLMLRVVNVLGKDIPAKLFKETQKIEADGGMLIMNGARRRTPGGVFLFLLKHNEEISKEDKKAIFLEDKKATIKERKNLQAVNREKKVEELKKTLNRQVGADSELLPTRSDLMLSHLKPETHSTLSNPPPSPVGDELCEGSSDYHPHHVHLNVPSPEKGQADDSGKCIDSESESCPARSSSSHGIPTQPVLQSYEDDYLDMTCDDMNIF